MTMRSRTILILLAAALFALPASALAQSAGDDQYQDPLAPSQGGSGGGGGGNGGGGGSGGGGGGGGSSESGADQNAQEAQTADSGQATAAQAGDQLPHTGFPGGALVLGGVVLLGGGVALRRAAVRIRG
jgi:LPXTG-motif cell wall-anchored protein